MAPIVKKVKEMPPELSSLMETPDIKGVASASESQLNTINPTQFLMVPFLLIPLKPSAALAHSSGVQAPPSSLRLSLYEPQQLRSLSTTLVGNNFFFRFGFVTHTPHVQHVAHATTETTLPTQMQMKAFMKPKKKTNQRSTWQKMKVEHVVDISKLIKYLFVSS
jgi:hypothetical protein